MNRKLLIFSILLSAICCSGCRNDSAGKTSASIIAEGHAPSLAEDGEGHLHLAFCRGDSILYTFSADQGISFAGPVLVAILPGLSSSHARGPQIAVNGQDITIIAGNKSGNIFSFGKKGEASWSKMAQVNDRDSTSREELMALNGDGNRLYAVWLDERAGHNQLYGSTSADGGASWAKNNLIYASPDLTICECCKPSVAVRGNQVYVMFRNLIDGNRDLYLVQSGDGGKTFAPAEKLGTGSWKLNGCPMDGGALVINADGIPQTVWRRDNKIFACEPGKPELEIADGRSCSMAVAATKNVYVWTEKGDVICGLSPEKKQNLGKGNLPVVKATGDHRQVICVWENDRQLHSVLINL